MGMVGVWLSIAINLYVRAIYISYRLRKKDRLKSTSLSLNYAIKMGV